VSNESEKTNTIQGRYATQVAADLKRVHEEQTELRARLELLQKEETWLSRLQTTLPGAQNASQQAEAGTAAETSADAPTASTAVVTVPQPRRSRKKAASGAGRGRKKAAQVKPAPTASAPAADAKKADVKKAARREGPTLGALVLGLLTGHGEPRTVKEVEEDLATAHPERPVTTQVVRNALESLVAKGDVERAKKQRSVMYTATEAASGSEDAPEAVHTSADEADVEGAVAAEA
jgi:hypothetical protein